MILKYFQYISSYKKYLHHIVPPLNKYQIKLYIHFFHIVINIEIFKMDNIIRTYSINYSMIILHLQFSMFNEIIMKILKFCFNFIYLQFLLFNKVI